MVLMKNASLDNGTAIANVDPSKVKTFCNVGDNICVNGDLVSIWFLCSICMADFADSRSSPAVW